MCHTREMDSRVSISRVGEKYATATSHASWSTLLSRFRSVGVDEDRGSSRETQTKTRIERKATRREKKGETGFFSFCTEFWMDIRLSHDRATLVRRLIRANRVPRNWSVAVYTRVFFHLHAVHSWYVLLCLVRLCQYWNRHGANV